MHPATDADAYYELQYRGFRVLLLMVVGAILGAVTAAAVLIPILRLYDAA